MSKLLLITMLACVGIGRAETETIFPSKDNTLYESTAGNLSNGVGFYLFVGTTAANAVRRTVLHFDLSSIPSGSRIVGTELILYMDKSKAGSTQIGIHRMASDWGEGNSAGTRGEGSGGEAASEDATWLHARHPNERWLREGGDFTQAISAIQTVAGIGDYSWSNDALTADVQHWVDRPTENFGWMLVGDESTAPTAKRFASRDNPTSQQRPRLVVDYVLMPVNSAPVIQDSVPSQQMAPGQTLGLALSPYFYDADGDTLTFTAQIDDSNLATVWVLNDSLRITSLADSAGSTTIVLTASDGRGGTASLQFSLSQQVIPSPLNLPGDFNGDRVVDFTDFFSFSDHFGLRSEDSRWDASYDLDGDDDVDFEDFFIFADYFGQRT